MTSLTLQAIALTLSCFGLLGVLFSTSNKGKIYPLFLGALWLIVLLSAAASWTAVAGRVSPGVVHEISGWYWWLLPAFCGYVIYENYTKVPLTEKQTMRLRMIGAIVISTILIVVVIMAWPAHVFDAVKPLLVPVSPSPTEAETALDSLNKIQP